MKELFTNLITINTKPEAIQNVLKNPQRLLEWIPEIQSVKAGENHFHIRRISSALNQLEVLSVTTTTDSITYHSTKGRLEYDLVFKLTGADDQTIVAQTLLLKSKTPLSLPACLLAPIAKHAFKQNLNGLKNLVEVLAYQD